MEKLILFENQLNDLSTRLTAFENNAVEEGQKSRADFNSLKSDLANLMADYNSLKKELEKEEINSELTKEEIEQLFSYAKDFIESIFANEVGNDRPEFQDMRFEVDNYIELRLDYIEVDTTYYIDNVISTLNSSSSFSDFLIYVERDNTEIANIIGSKEGAKFIWNKIVSKLIDDELTRLQGFYSWNNIDDSYYELELNYSNEIDISSLTISDWYNDVIVNEFDLSMFMDDLEQELLEPLEGDDDSDDENNSDDSE